MRSMLEPGGLAQYAATGILLKKKQKSWLPIRLPHANTLAETKTPGQ